VVKSLSIEQLTGASCMHRDRGQRIRSMHPEFSDLLKSDLRI
jgi:hypothetical protein